MAKSSSRQTVPVSLRLSAQLRNRIKKYAASRGLEEATAIRALCTERLLEIELTEDLVAAEDWQMARALESWDRLNQNALKVYSSEEVRRVFWDDRNSKR